MSGFEVALAPQSERDIADAFRWYSERSSAAADAFRTEALGAIDELRRNAANWRQGSDGTRRRVLKHFPYTVVYELDGTTATVLALAHHRRRPGYWQPA